MDGPLGLYQRDPGCVRSYSTENEMQQIRTLVAFVMMIITLALPARAQSQDEGTAEATALTAICRWDVVPYQVVNEPTPIGVLAFHANHIERVVFSIAGGRELATVRTPRYNPATRAVEHWFVVDPDELPVGPVDIVATAYPIGGTPRSMTITLVGNKTPIPNAQRWVSPSGNDAAAGTASAPLKTIAQAIKSLQDSMGGDAGGGTVYLMGGDHVISFVPWNFGLRAERTWVNVTAAPGLRRDSVRVTGWDSNGLGARLLKLSNITIRSTVNGRDQARDQLWVDGCDYLGTTRSEPARWHGAFNAIYVTNSNVSTSRNGIEGAALVRNVVIDNIGSDALSNSLCVVNCWVSNMDHRGTDLHPDVYQWYGAPENIVLYGVRATNNIRGQGFFAGANILVKDVAMVYCRLDNLVAAGNVGHVWQFGGPTRHLIVYRSWFNGPCRWNTGLGFNGENIFLVSSLFLPNGIVPANQGGVNTSEDGSGYEDPGNDPPGGNGGGNGNGNGNGGGDPPPDDNGGGGDDGGSGGEEPPPTEQALPPHNSQSRFVGPAFYIEVSDRRHVTNNNQRGWAMPYGDLVSRHGWFSLVATTSTASQMGYKTLVLWEPSGQPAGNASASGAWFSERSVSDSWTTTMRNDFDDFIAFCRNSLDLEVIVYSAGVERVNRGTTLNPSRPPTTNDQIAEIVASARFAASKGATGFGLGGMSLLQAANPQLANDVVAALRSDSVTRGMILMCEGWPLPGGVALEPNIEVGCVGIDLLDGPTAASADALTALGSRLEMERASSRVPDRVRGWTIRGNGWTNPEFERVYDWLVEHDLVPLDWRMDGPRRYRDARTRAGGS